MNKISSEIASLKSDINILNNSNKKINISLKKENENLSEQIGILSKKLTDLEKDLTSLKKDFEIQKVKLTTIELNNEKESTEKKEIVTAANKFIIRFINISVLAFLILPVLILIAYLIVYFNPNAPQWIRSIGLFSLNNLSDFSNIIFHLIKFITAPTIIFLMLFSIDESTLKRSTALFWSYLTLVIVLTILTVVFKNNNELIQFLAEDITSPLLVGLIFYKLKLKYTSNKE